MLLSEIVLSFSGYSVRFPFSEVEPHGHSYPLLFLRPLTNSFQFSSDIQFSCPRTSIIRFSLFTSNRTTNTGRIDCTRPNMMAKMIDFQTAKPGLRIVDAIHGFLPLVAGLFYLISAAVLALRRDRRDETRRRPSRTVVLWSVVAILVTYVS